MRAWQVSNGKTLGSLKWLLLLCALCLAGWMVYLAAFRYDASRAVSSADELSSRRVLRIEGFNSAKFDGEQPVSRIQFEHLDVRPRKFGLFKVRSFNEVFIKGLHIETYGSRHAVAGNGLNGDSAGEDSLGKVLVDNLGNLRQLRGIGQVQRVTIEGFRTLRLAASPRQTERSVSARRAVFDVQKKRLVLENAQVDQVAPQRRLAASRLTWDERNRQWVTDAQTTFWERDRKSMLKNARLDESLALIQ